MMTLWYDLCELLPIEFLHWDFMKNALLAVLIMSPLFGLLSTTIVTGKMSFFSDALGHSAFTGIAIGCIFGITTPTVVAVVFSILFALAFSFVKNRSSHTADTLIGVFSSTAVALGIFIATFGGGSFTKYNAYLIGDILSVTPSEIGLLVIVLILVLVFWVFFSNKMTLTAIHPALSSSRGISINMIQTGYTTLIAIVVTLAISWVGLLILNSLLVLPAAASRNIAKNMKQYHLLSILFALVAGISGLIVSYYLGTSSGASICLILAILFVITFCCRKAVK